MSNGDVVEWVTEWGTRHKFGMPRTRPVGNGRLLMVRASLCANHYESREDYQTRPERRRCKRCFPEQSA